MSIDREKVISLLKESDFSTLFTQQLGWDKCSGIETVSVCEEQFSLQLIAEKRGVCIYICLPDRNGNIPPVAIRAAIERKIAKLAYEHLLIFINADKTEHLWLYPKRAPGRPVRLIPYRFDPRKSNELLLQKLESIKFTLNEEEELTLLEVTKRIKETLDRDKVTRSFYQKFAKERDNFQKFLNGIPDVELARWYIAVIMNRLMFIYFIQEKGFLNGEHHYLQNHLNKCKGNYYQDFLCPLFFQGFALQESARSAEIKNNLGKVPYLNGGIFQKHQIEELHGKSIEIENRAFKNLFTFFDQYRWHLDERPLAAGNEINPEVLGYIFEKYINQKQMGAYYTKEDITEYISKNTVIPSLIDKTRSRCRIAFDNPKGPTVWDMLKEDPDRYIYPAVRHGITWKYNSNHPDKGEPLDNPIPLPSEIAKGIDTKSPDLIERRKLWNNPALEEYALPTEIWREVVSRRQRYEEIKDKIIAGEIKDTNDLISLNLDLRQFAQDMVEYCEGPELLRAFWHALEKITILDPTCGSGAFLFAALNILEPLYEACLQRMHEFLEDLDRLEEKHRPEKYSDFRKILAKVSAHPNRQYFIFKNIILKNLYGVDIMQEAVEICKLRLFLKLAAQVEPDVSAENYGIEPLPDIDFNIRAGNTLVGFATYQEVENAVPSQLYSGDTMTEISKKAADLQQYFDAFREKQVEGDGSVPVEHKHELEKRLNTLNNELNQYLAGQYGVTKEKDYKHWFETHHPFHWFIEFYGIMNSGGFDVIIGNPPYVEYSKVKNEYKIKNFETEKCGNLYVFILEQILELIVKNGYWGMIVPISLPSTPRMNTIRSLLSENTSFLWCSNFADRPGTLFNGVHQKLSILIAVNNTAVKGNFLYTTTYNHWYGKNISNERESLFQNIAYLLQKVKTDSCDWLKFGHKLERTIYKQIKHQNIPVSAFFKGGGKIFLNMRMMYWTKCFITPQKSQEYKKFNALNSKVIAATLNSSLFFWFWEIISDVWHVTKKELNNFTFNLNDITEKHRLDLENLCIRLMDDLEKNKLYVGTKQTDYEYYNRLSKSIIDEIDKVLAKHYGFTEEELDYIINYDIKYRMGQNSENEDE